MSGMFCTCDDNSNKTEAKTTLPYLVLGWANVVYFRKLFSCCSGCVAAEREMNVKDILQTIVTLLGGGNEENDDKYQAE